MADKALTPGAMPFEALLERAKAMHAQAKYGIGQKWSAETTIDALEESLGFVIAYLEGKGAG